MNDDTDMEARARFVLAARYARANGGRVVRRPDGSVTIELPPDTSDAVVMRFEQLLGVR